MVTPSRITLARKRRGLTLADLSARAGVSLQSLSNYETGRTAPRPSTVRRLADALDFPERFFSGPDIDELPAEGISWRARTKTPPRVLDSARAAGTLAAQLYEWIDERFRLPEPDLPSLGKPDPETAAEMVRTVGGWVPLRRRTWCTSWRRTGSGSFRCRRTRWRWMRSRCGGARFRSSS